MADGESMNLQVTITDRSAEALDAVKIAISRALWAMGATAEGHAKNGNVPVDTGLLRNSITFAVGGSAPNTTHYKADKPDKSGVIRSGSYVGMEPKGNHVSIGSNVEYAAAQELGSSRGIRPHHFLKDAVANHTEEYKSIVKDSMSNV